MSNVNPNNIRLTPKIMEDGAKTLQKVVDACRDCLENGTQWSKACRSRGLNAKNARWLLSNKLETFTDIPDTELKNMDTGQIREYDGCELFYRAVFGNDTIDQSALPKDYKETVLYVIKEAVRTRKGQEVLTHYFGLGDDCLPKSFAEIGRIYNVTRNDIGRIERRALHSCRCEPYISMLIHGLEEYRLLEAQARELEEQKKAYIREEHAALMAKHAAEHARRMETIASNSYSEAAMLSLPEDMMDTLANTHVRELNLTTRPYNALVRNGITSILDLLREGDYDQLKKIRCMGDESAKATVRRLDEYTKENYGIMADRLRRLCFPDKEAEE